MQVKPANFITQMVSWVVMAVNAFLGLRFLLRLFGADPTNNFVTWVYENTHPLLAPFSGIFQGLRLEGGYTVEFTTLFAVIVYSLLGFLVMTLVASLAPPTTKK